MTESTPALKIILLAGLFVALPVSTLGFIRTFKAKTIRENIYAHLMFLVPILSIFLVAFMAGFMELPTFDDERLKDTPDPIKSLGNLKPLQIFFLACAFGIGLIGNVILWHSHWKRTNKKWTTLMNPVAPPFAEFNSKEWLVFWCLMAAFFVFGVAALAV